MPFVRAGMSAGDHLRARRTTSDEPVLPGLVQVFRDRFLRRQGTRSSGPVEVNDLEVIFSPTPDHPNDEAV